MQIEKIPIKKINPAPYNPRKDLKPGDPEYDKLKRSILEFDMVEPLVWNKQTGNLVGGHQRLKILIENGETRVDCSVVDLSKSKEKALNIALNKIQGEWDFPKLRDLLLEIDTGEFDIDITGFDAGELEQLVASYPIEGNEAREDEFDVDKALEDIEEPKTKRGDIIELGRHRLMCGDSKTKEDILKLVGNSKIDSVFTDPPYGIEVVGKEGKVGGGGTLPTHFGRIGGGNIVPSKIYHSVRGDESVDAAQEFYGICQSIGIQIFILWGGNHFTEFLSPSRGWVVWDKEQTGNFSQVELAWTSFDCGAKLYRWAWNGLVRKGIRKDELVSRIHPTQKPVGLHAQILKDFEMGENILDGFMGSGSLLIACEQSEKNCYAMEIDPKYCDVIVERWQTFTGKKAKYLKE